MSDDDIHDDIPQELTEPPGQGRLFINGAEVPYRTTGGFNLVGVRPVYVESPQSLVWLNEPVDS